NGPCTELDGERRCSQSCNPSVADACPQGYDCLSTGLCWPASEGGGCRAAAGGTRPDERFPLAVLSALFTGAVLLVRRSRRSA
ncbi:MAG TPA: hypothetical protein VEL05_08870, partial [Candidatus Acidoferrum sp.]|nr:hypothetical protein [Candidatus Acidoferrum sp.]